MKPSVVQVTRSLGLSTEQSTAVRDACRDWLETQNNHDDSKIARLRKDDVEKQAARFLRRRGQTYFSEPIRKGLVRSINDPKLLKDVTNLMYCQVRYKSKKLRGSDLPKRTQASEGSDEDSDGTQDTPGSDQVGSQEDYEYQPSHATPSSAKVKLHYTRQSAPNGMPIQPSIEHTRMADGAREGSSLRRDELIRVSYSEDDSDTEASNAFSTPSKSSRNNSEKLEHNQHATGTLDISVPLRDVTRPVIRPRVQMSPVLNQENTVMMSGALAAPVIQSSQPALEVASGQYRRSITIPLPREFPEHDFDQYMEPFNSDTSLADLLYSSYNNEIELPPIPSISNPRCEQTPPSSGRPTTRTRVLAANEMEEVDAKPLLSQRVEVDLTEPEKQRIFLGGDHYEIIEKDQAALVLQCFIDALNDKSRHFQRVVQRDMGTMAMRKDAEQRAIWMCEMMKDLRGDKQIWNPYGSSILDNGQT